MILLRNGKAPRAVAARVSISRGTDVIQLWAQGQTVEHHPKWRES